jgi:hypothetical protein
MRTRPRHVDESEAIVTLFARQAPISGASPRSADRNTLRTPKPLPVAPFL